MESVAEGEKGGKDGPAGVQGVQNLCSCEGQSVVVFPTRRAGQ